MSGALLAARGLSFALAGRPILGPLDVELARGDALAVVGPNGAGKTTLLRLLAGLLAPSAGRVTWEGEPFAALGRRQLARRIAYVPQVRPSRVPLSVEQLVLLGRFPHLARWRLAPRRRDFAAVERALAVVGLEPLRRRGLDTLSGGERQAVYICAALAQEAEVLILDEPTTHLDPGHQRSIAALIRRLHGSEKRTVVMATHDLHLAQTVASRVLALRDGRAQALGGPAEVLAPAPLERLFAAPFVELRGGARPVTMLDLGEP